MSFTVTLTPTDAAIPSELVNVIKGDPAGGGGGGATNLAYTASPTGGTVTSDTGTDATLTLADATNAGLMSPAQHSKLAGIASGATANATDAQLRDRSTHTGTQTASTIIDFNSAASAAAPVQSVAGRTGAVTIAAADITDSTTAGRAVLTAADAAAQRTALGLGDAATKSVGTGSGAVAAGNDSRFTETIALACSDETTDLTAGTAKVTFRMPYAFTLSAVRASVTTAPTGSALTVDINAGGASILSTKLTIDADEKTSTTAATPAVISDSALADDAEITIDIDSIGSSVAGTGLKVYLIGQRA